MTHHGTPFGIDCTEPPPRTISHDATNHPQPLVSVVMGSRSDWETMAAAAELLTHFDIPHETLVVSAHRTPAWLAAFASEAEHRGIEVIIAGAGGAAHLPGMMAAQTPIPVLGVPVETHALKGMDSLLSIVQMPAGIPVGTLAHWQARRAECGFARHCDSRQQPTRFTQRLKSLP